MENLKYSCSIHKNQEILFICAVNQWHFQPLCQQCTPSHSQNHPKRIKVKLQSFKKIQQQTIKQKDIVIQQYKKRLQQIDSIVNEKEIILQYQKELQITQHQLIQQIKIYFNKLKVQTNAAKQKLLAEQNQKLHQIKNILKSQIDLMQILNDQNLTIDQWRDSAKKIYFKDKMEAYLQQSKESIQEFKNNLSKFMPVKIQSNIKISQKILEILTNSVKIFQQQKQDKNNKKQQTNSALKKKPIKIVKKLCKNCNQQMQYLTQWKKHLICRYCGGKQRNYLKQK